MKEIHISADTKSKFLYLMTEICKNGHKAVLSELQLARFGITRQELRDSYYTTIVNCVDLSTHVILPEHLRRIPVPPQLIPLTSNLHKAYMDLIDKEAKK